MSSPHVFSGSSHNQLPVVVPSKYSHTTAGTVINISAPGKVILFGEHAVVYGKLAIAASLGLRTKLSLVELSESNTLGIELCALNLSHSYDFTDVSAKLFQKPVPVIKSSSNFCLERPDLIDHEQLQQLVENYLTHHSGSQPLNVYQQLALASVFYLFVGIFGSVNIKLEPLTVRVETELTVSAGTGSSASFLVTVAAAFIQYIKIKAARDNLREISKSGYKSCKITITSVDYFDKREMELISKWAYCAERIIHGTPSGIDNTICTFGSMVEYRKGFPPTVVELSQEFKALLVNTKVIRSTKTQVTRVMELREKHHTIVENVLEALNGISQSALQYLTSVSMLAADSRPDSKEVQYQLKSYYERLGELNDLAHNLLRGLGVSHDTLDTICNTVKEHGLHGKLTGAGGGGYALALIPNRFPQAVLNKLITKLNSLGFESIVTELGGPGVTVD